MSVSQGYFGNDLTCVVSDSSISAYRIVYGDTTDTTNALKAVKVAAAATYVPLGVTTEATTAADTAIAIRVGGVAKIECNGSGTNIDIGTPIMATTAGKGIAASTGGATAQWCIGTALEPSAADGDIINVLIDRCYYPVGA